MIKTHKTRTKHKTLYETFLFNGIALGNINASTGTTALCTTGLLHAPTAEMQKDKTIMIGGNMIDHNIYRSSYWGNSREYNPYTFNYYLNITIFPWLEVAYTCT